MVQMAVSISLVRVQALGPGGDQFGPAPNSRDPGSVPPPGPGGDFGPGAGGPGYDEFGPGPGGPGFDEFGPGPGGPRVR